MGGASGGFWGRLFFGDKPPQDPTSLIAIPPASGTYKVHSASAPGASYRVELSTLSCDCEDHRMFRRASEARDVRRCCRHIGGLLVRKGIVRAEHELVHLILTGEHGIGGELLVLDALEYPVVVSDSSSGWLNLWTRGQGRRGRPDRYRWYGWCRAEGRWALGKVPPASAEIVAALAHRFPLVPK